MFQTSLISVESLHKVIPVNQLTQEFEGTLPYDNDQWIETRIVSGRFGVAFGTV